MLYQRGASALRTGRPPAQHQALLTLRPTVHASSSHAQRRGQLRSVGKSANEPGARCYVRDGTPGVQCARPCHSSAPADVVAYKHAADTIRRAPCVFLTGRGIKATCRPQVRCNPRSPGRRRQQCSSRARAECGGTLTLVASVRLVGRAAPPHRAAFEQCAAARHPAARVHRHNYQRGGEPRTGASSKHKPAAAVAGNSELCYATQGKPTGQRTRPTHPNIHQTSLQRGIRSQLLDEHVRVCVRVCVCGRCA